jgi:hypothetical protein
VSDKEERLVRGIVRDELREVRAAAEVKAKENPYTMPAHLAAVRDALRGIIAAVDERAAAERDDGGKDAG